MDYAENRQKLVSWLRQQLQGPASKKAAERLVGVSPLERYPVGMLFPVIEGQGLDAAADEFDDLIVEPTATQESTQEQIQTARSRRYTPPSSMGFSFYLKDDETASWELEVGFSAAIYRQAENREKESGQYVPQEYLRLELGGDTESLSKVQGPVRLNVMPKPDSETEEYCAEIDIRSRKHQDGQIITVSLANIIKIIAEPNTYRQQELEATLFEARLDCRVVSGNVGDYPSVDYSLLDDEMQELSLQYQHKKIYAVGHGCAVDWILNGDEVQSIHSDFMPTVEVPQMTADVLNRDSPVLQMCFLQRVKEEPELVLSELEQFVDQYADWVREQQTQSQSLATLERAAAQRITQRMQNAQERMRTGVNCLRQNLFACQAFAWMNQIMLAQMLQVGTITGKARPLSYYCWRPFQLAFILTTLQSSIDDEDAYRDTVDLIWFPTGGGKTEAYLGLIAFVILWRRLSFPHMGGGTTVFMRYTLRLLTTQQYLRACRMICALELLRQRHSESLGEEPITIGLWVGKQTSPNTFQEAQTYLAEAAQGASGKLALFVLQSCPWCQSPFELNRNYRSSNHSFHLVCTDDRCDFGRQRQVLPCNVIDEALYQSPPTMLLATIDKFSRLIWEERAQVFFGTEGKRPPELIVQDELHLIASALGSIAGLYEAGIETILRVRDVYPKYIASTATIRMAKEQVQALYAKTVAVFPPPGLSAEDSFFAKTVPIQQRPGRLYLGYFAPRLNRQRNAAPLAASLLAAPELIFQKAEIEHDLLREAWWTQLLYHGSLRGVGNTQNLFNVEIKNFFQRLEEEAFFTALGSYSSDIDLKKAYKKWRKDEQLSQRFAQRPAFLTSQSSPEENAATFTDLEKPRGTEGSIDAVLATNMVSVGLDVGRLALMVINGQPLTTAEYIQASSRVGRSEVPGIVCVNFYRDQARSLSHYENFRPYHESFYRFVEATSVTPYTYQARRRALHAALVLALRYAVPFLSANSQAGAFDRNNPEVQRVVQQLIRRCGASDPSRAHEIQAHIHELVEQWHDYAQRSTRDKRALYYKVASAERQARRLLYQHGDKIQGLWLTLQSMRNVESTGLINAR